MFMAGFSEYHIPIPTKL